MKNLSLLALASLMAISFSAAATAEGGMHMKGKHKGMLKLMDVNGDGTVDKAEFKDFHDQNFSGADKNRDGNLDAAEFVVFQKIMQEQHEKAKAMAKKKKAQKHFDKMDANGDGKISKAEFEAKSDRRFIRMDHNDDGVLNKEDRAKKMHKMKKNHRMGDRN